MTDFEAIAEAGRRLGIPQEELDQVDKEARMLFPNETSYAVELAPGTEEKAIAGYMEKMRQISELPFDPGIISDGIARAQSKTN